jgi:spore coat polysaccharide biosynthesis predicted glycosyltransferase SpsG
LYAVEKMCVFLTKSDGDNLKWKEWKEWKEWKDNNLINNKNMDLMINICIFRGQYI